ncbi:MAG: DegT/DnrJ/EryC1/StrS family aminotransferase, partial [Candidatus Eremiobacterota bacterium]
HGAEIDGKKVGTFGDAGAFSFYPTKNLGAIGDGGAVVTASDHIKERLLLIRQYGWKKRYISEIPGMNSRLDEIQAAILRIKLSSLEEDNRKRREIAGRYVEAMEGKMVTTPAKIGGTLHAMHLFVIETDKRDEMQMYLKSQHIGTAIHYPYAIHEQPAYAGRIRGSDNLPFTERLYRKCLTLPLYPEMNEEDIEKIVKTLKKWEP